MSKQIEQRWQDHEQEQLLRWLATSPAERLHWLDQAKRFAHKVRCQTSETAGRSTTT